MKALKIKTSGIVSQRSTTFHFRSFVRVCTLKLRRCTLDLERAASLSVAFNLLICQKIDLCNTPYILANHRISGHQCNEVSTVRDLLFVSRILPKVQRSEVYEMRIFHFENVGIVCFYVLFFEINICIIKFMLPHALYVIIDAMRF